MRIYKPRDSRDLWIVQFEEGDSTPYYIDADTYAEAADGAEKLREAGLYEMLNYEGELL